MFICTLGLSVFFGIHTVCCQDLAPGEPFITGPRKIKINDRVILTCSSLLGSPIQNVTWLQNDAIVPDTTRRIVGGFVKSYVTFTASRKEHMAVFDCAVDNGVLKNTMKRSYQVEVLFSPQFPILTGPTIVNAGKTAIWTCISYDGYRLQNMTMRIGDKPFDNEFNTKSRFNTTGKGFDVTGTLTWTPTMVNDGKSLYCDVQHDTLSSVQTTNLKIDVRESPSPPIVTGPDKILLDNNVTLTCSTKDGDPEPTIKWFRGGSQISGTAQITRLRITTSTINFRATKDENRKIYKCQVSNEVLSTPLIRKYVVKILYTPDTPSLDGPTILKTGDYYTWTCISRNGSPAPTMTMRLGNAPFTKEFTVTSSYNTTIKSYIVTGILTWAPTLSNNWSTIFCTVNHVTLTDPQSVGLLIAVNGISQVLRENFAHNSITLFWGEIVSVILLALALVGLILLCAYLQGCCGICCSTVGLRKKKDVVVEQKHIHIYRVAIVASRERKDFEIKKYEVVSPDMSKVSCSVCSNSTSVPASQLLHSNNSYTYEKEERVRQLWKRSKKRNRQSEYLSGASVSDDQSLHFDDSKDIQLQKLSGGNSYSITQKMIFEEIVPSSSDYCDDDNL